MKSSFKVLKYRKQVKRKAEIVKKGRQEKMEPECKPRETKGTG